MSGHSKILELLRVLDHPQAVYILQRRFSRGVTNGFHDEQDELEVESSPVHYYGSMVDLCVHCNRTVNFCASVGLGCKYPSNLSQNRCSRSTLQDLVNVLSSPLSISVSSLSSIALHNILVLIEQNLQCFLPGSIENFLCTTEEYLIKDDWCKFLVNAIKMRIGSLNLQETELMDTSQNGLSRKDESVTTASEGIIREECESEPPGAIGSGKVMKTNELMEGIEDSSMENSEYNMEGILDEIQEKITTGVEPSPEVAGGNNQDVSLKYVALITKICDEWSSYKAAKQADFELLCSLGNSEFSACMKMFDCAKLSVQSITGISKNISSLRVELSYHNSTVLVQAVILPIVIGLDQTASRDVVSSLCVLNSTYPDCLTQTLLLPLIQHQNFGSFHSSLIIKVLEDSATKQELENLWRCLINNDKDNASPIWTEDVVGIALFLVQQKVTLISQSASNLVGLLQRTSASLCKNSKFAKLMVELCKSQNYREQMTQFRVELLEIAEGHKSILKSALLREVKKL